MDGVENLYELTLMHAQRPVEMKFLRNKRKYVYTKHRMLFFTAVPENLTELLAG